MDTNEIDQKITDATAARDAAHRNYTAALHAGANSGPTWIALGAANKTLSALKDERHRIITGFEPWAGIKSARSIEDVDATLAACDAPRTPDAVTYDLGTWELSQLQRILFDAIESDRAKGLSGEGAARLRQIFTTEGNVSVIVRHSE